MRQGGEGRAAGKKPAGLSLGGGRGLHSSALFLSCFPRHLFVHIPRCLSSFSLPLHSAHICPHHMSRQPSVPLSLSPGAAARSLRRGFRRTWLGRPRALDSPAQLQAQAPTQLLKARPEPSRAPRQASKETAGLGAEAQLPSCAGAQGTSPDPALPLQELLRSEGPLSPVSTPPWWTVEKRRLRVAEGCSQGYKVGQK